MKTQSNICPKEIEIIEFGKLSEIVLRENIAELKNNIENEDGTVFIYDEYRLTVPTRLRLSEVVASSKEEWLKKARQAEYDELAVSIRKKRNALLAETDSRMCFDRFGLEIPSSSYFTDWVFFLKDISHAITGKWAKYRQELRDITKQEGFPYHVDFPKPPNEDEI